MIRNPVFAPWLLAGLTWLAFGLRVAGLHSQSLWRDEVDAIRFAARPWGELLHTFVQPGQNGPLYFALLRPWLHLAGQSEFSLRFLSVLMGVVAVPLAYRLARRLFPRLPAVGLLAALFMATSPYLVWYGQEGKMYTLAAALVLLSMERFLAACELGGWHRWAAYVVVTGAACYVHLVAALIIPAQAVAFIALPGAVRRSRWRPWLTSLAALTLPYVPLLVWQIPLLLHPADTGFAFVPLPQMVYSLLSGFSLGVLPNVAGWAVPLFAALGLVAVLLWWQGRARPGSLGVLLIWLALPVLGFFLVTLVRPLFTVRYLIFVLPAFFLLIAAGVVAIGWHSRLLAGAAVLGLLLANGRGLWFQAHTPIKTDLRSATRYVMDRLAPDDLILFQIPYSRYSFDYYWQQLQTPSPSGGEYKVFLPLLAGGGGQSYRWAEGLYTNAGMTADDVDRGMSQLTAGSRVVWLIATEVPLWDERGLVQSWLDAHGLVADKAEFTRVTIYRYLMN